jgi:hypothetical protein
LDNLLQGCIPTELCGFGALEALFLDYSRWQGLLAIPIRLSLARHACLEALKPMTTTMKQPQTQTQEQSISIYTNDILCAHARLWSWSWMICNGRTLRCFSGMNGRVIETKKRRKRITALRKTCNTFIDCGTMSARCRQACSGLELSYRLAYIGPT